MKMITKVFIVIAILLVCLAVWALFLGDGGLIEMAWNGVADMVNTTWQTISGSSDDIMQPWDSDKNSVGDAQDGIDNP
jgi:hypothetical protein